MPTYRPVPTRFTLRPGERRILLIIGDLAMASLAITMALIIWAIGDPTFEFSREFILRTPTWFFSLPLIWLLLMSGLYDEKRSGNWDETLRTLAMAAVVGIVTYAVIYFINPPKSLPRRGVASFSALVLILTLIWRFLYIKIFTAPQFLRRVLLVGGGETGQIILRIVAEMIPPPFVLVGIIDDDPQKIGKQMEGYKVLGDSSQLLSILHDQKITDLIVAISGKMNGMMFQALLDAQEAGVDIIRMPVAYEDLLGRVPILYLEADWILRSFVDELRWNVFYGSFKRLIDIVGALCGVIFIGILFPFIALAIILDSGFPILYNQMRMGRGGSEFEITKFRTMLPDADKQGNFQTSENDIRTTRVGKFLRKTHLDETPQFLNVLRGEMSIVGPRAERPELVELYQKKVPFYRSRLLVKPGITGWAQVNQSYAATVDENIVKLEYDLYYIKHQSLGLDIRIIFRTPMMVIGMKGR
jgi:exopolysaccharide biosynthesis polyprenyl glycosylphosphotransferase